jgi:hypothetical protein
LKTEKSEHEQPLAQSAARRPWHVAENETQRLAAPKRPSREGGLDGGAARAAGRAHPAVAAVAALDGAENGAGQGALPVPP